MIVLQRENPWLDWNRYSSAEALSGIGSAPAEAGKGTEIPSLADPSACARLGGEPCPT
jgi:hypothetical protein